MPTEDTPKTESSVANKPGEAADTGSGGSAGSDKKPLPLFVHEIFSFVPGTDGLGGGGGGHSTLGGAPTDRDPVFVVYTYPFVPPKPPKKDIDHS